MKIYLLPINKGIYQKMPRWSLKTDRVFYVTWWFAPVTCFSHAIYPCTQTWFDASRCTLTLFLCQKRRIRRADAWSVLSRRFPLTVLAVNELAREGHLPSCDWSLRIISQEPVADWSHGVGRWVFVGSSCFYWFWTLKNFENTRVVIRQSSESALTLHRIIDTQKCVTVDLVSEISGNTPTQIFD